MPQRKIILLITIALITVSCSTTGVSLRSRRATGDHHGSAEGATYKIGSPYQINGVWYYPKEDYSYNEVGTASWYGPQFHSKLTANGEIYDMYALTAAHPTLPMPSMVKVTNLQNGRSLVLRINDRGPFARDRIIDISKRGAQLLGFIEQGTAKVRVEVLADESISLKNQLLTSEGRVNLGSMAGANNLNNRQNDYLATPIVSSIPDAVQDIPNITPASNSVDTYDIWQEPTSIPAKVLEPTITKPSSFAKTDYTLATGAKILVQVGAFSSYENAKKLSDKIANISNAYITDIDINGQKFYRVRINSSNEVDAQSIISRLISVGYSDARIVRE